MSERRKIVLYPAGCNGYVLQVFDIDGNGITVPMTFEEGMDLAEGIMNYLQHHAATHLAQSVADLKPEELQEKLEATGPKPGSDTSWIDQLEKDLNHNDIEGAEG